MASLSLYRIASGKPGKKFTMKEFLKITSEHEELKSGTGQYKVEMPDGYIYRGSSKEELRVIRRLLENKAIKCLRGQCIPIPYRFGGKDHNYYPDLIVLTNTNKIVIVEVKQIAEMGTKVNQRKYKALKYYCEYHGYLYVMCDKAFRTFQGLTDKRLNGKVEMAIDNAIKQKGRFDYNDFLELTAGVTQKERNRVRKRIGEYVVSRSDYVKEIGNLTNATKSFMIKSKKGRKVYERPDFNSILDDFLNNN